MTDRDQPDDIRRPQPEQAAQDGENAARQEQVHRDHDALVEQKRRVDASVPDEVKDRTIGETRREIERDADRDR
ncbi:MAG TPA: hypothetical protein VEA99_20265 [Gemmatimonadaceae bacterium]|nr:hypothetical protein [Gemmatimonadaceae bacterium]